jgi:transposase InsO family protein
MKKQVNKIDDSRVLPIVRDLTGKRPTYGYRRITALLRAQTGEKINAKRVYRIMKQNQLLLTRFTGKPTRTHEGKVQTIKSDVRWCSDAFGIQCWNGEQLQIVFSLDCHDREAITWAASSRGIDGELVRDLMTETIEQRFGKIDKLPHPVQWLSDNGPCYTARETVAYGRLRGLDVRTTPSYSPESNGMAEAFVKTFKRDYAWLADLSSAEKVLEQLPGWFSDYNENAPHKALKMKAPRQYRRDLNRVG